MKLAFSKFVFVFLAISALFLGCDQSEDNDDLTPESPSNFVIATSVTVSPFSGYLTSFGSSLPSGSVSNVKTSSQQASQLLGIRTFGKNIYRFRNAAGEIGIQKLSVDATTQTFKDEGFIACGSGFSGSGQHVVVNETTGFYWDPALGLLKLQKFNPTTMQRTGELDFTSKLSDATKEYISLGQNILMVKEGKLYANIHYGLNARKGYLDAVDGVIRFAVIDIASGNLDKVISFNTGAKAAQTGWFLENAMWDLGDDGHLYFCNLGGIGAGGSSIHRIKKGETEIDAAWQIKMEEITPNGFFHNILVRGGKIYTRIPTEGIKPDFSNIANEIWEYSTIDVNTKAIQKISGVPIVTFNGNANAIVEVDKAIYFQVVKDSQGINGYYRVNGTSATQAFNITEGGKVCGLAKL